jgi:hypothetical protein
MFRRVLAACFGALLFGVLVPVAYALFAGWPEGGFTTLILLAAVGVVVGASLGALFPKVFGFVFEVFMDV